MGGKRTGARNLAHAARQTGGGGYGSGPPLIVTVRELGGSCHVVLEGELDLAGAPTLERQLDRLQASGQGSLIVDLRRLSFVDVRGARVLLAADRRARAWGHRLTIVRGPRPVQRLLELVGADRVLDLVDGIEMLRRHVVLASRNHGRSAPPVRTGGFMAPRAGL